MVTYDIWYGIILRKWNLTSLTPLSMTKWYKVGPRLRDNLDSMTQCWTWLMIRSCGVGRIELPQVHGALGGRAGGWILAPSGVTSISWSRVLRLRSLRNLFQTSLTTGTHRSTSANEEETRHKNILSRPCNILHCHSWSSWEKLPSSEILSLVSGV